MTHSDERKPLPMREWLELGQAISDRSPIGPKYFRSWHTEMIWIGHPDGLRVGRKVYRGRFKLDDKAKPANDAVDERPAVA